MGAYQNMLWQCPNCGGILEKYQETMMLNEKVSAIHGKVTCSYCSMRVPTNSVYSGQFDFVDSDSLIRKIANDHDNIEFDNKINRWRYHGEIVLLACDTIE